jgi:AcrR family transcriptional regulator
MEIVSQEQLDREVSEWAGIEDFRSASSDGRHLRRAANRNGVIDACVSLFVEGNNWPTVAEVAERAGVSERSIFRYFDDVEELTRSAVESCVREAVPFALLPTPRPEDLGERIDAIVEARAKLFEHVAPISSVARVHIAHNKLVGETYRKVRSYLRQQLILVFGEELTALGNEGDDVLASLSIVLSFDTWFSLRSEDQLTVDETKRILRLMTRRIFALN